MNVDDDFDDGSPHDDDSDGATAKLSQHPRPYWGVLSLSYLQYHV